MAGTFNPPERIGFVGLGQMGAPMARNLARAGFGLALLDARPGIAAGLGLDAQLPADPAGVGAACRVVITMLPDGGIVRDALLGDGGIASTLAAGSVVIDMSSSSPVGTQQLGADLATRGIALIDAPVSGGVKRAIDGSLAIMAGGDAAVIERCRPILAAMGKQIFATGPLGSGHAMKALNNYVSAAGLVAAAEAMLAGSRFGLEAETVVNILNASTGRNNSTEIKFPQFILPRKFASGFSLGLMVKDLRTALDVAHATHTPAPVAETVVQAWAEAEKLLGGQADHTAVVQYWEALIEGKARA